MFQPVQAILKGTTESSGDGQSWPSPGDGQHWSKHVGMNVMLFCCILYCIVYYVVFIVINEWFAFSMEL